MSELNGAETVAIKEPKLEGSTIELTIFDGDRVLQGRLTLDADGPSTLVSRRNDGTLETLPVPTKQAAQYGRVLAAVTIEALIVGVATKQAQASDPVLEDQVTA